VPSSRSPSSTPRSVLRRAPTLPAPPPRRVIRPGRTSVPVPPLGRRRAPTGPIAIVLVLTGLFCVGLGLGNATGSFSLAGLFRGPDWPPPRAFPVLEPSRPLSIAIPSIKVEAPVRPVDLADDGSVAVPPLAQHNQAGWFGRGPTPGQFGPAMIVGHADTRTSPSIFHDLARLRRGARVEVTRADRSVAVFRVTSIEHFDKDRLPVDRVYGDYSRPALRLVTCTGRWLGGGIGYSDNLVVFASLMDARNVRAQAAASGAGRSSQSAQRGSGVR
jgi:sortase (surface protein transpeptidase)